GAHPVIMTRLVAGRPGGRGCGDGRVGGASGRTRRGALRAAGRPAAAGMRASPVGEGRPDRPGRPALNHSQLIPFFRVWSLPPLKPFVFHFARPSTLWWPGERLSGNV